MADNAARLDETGSIPASLISRPSAVRRMLLPSMTSETRPSPCGSKAQFAAKPSRGEAATQSRAQKASATRRGCLDIIGEKTIASMFAQFGAFRSTENVGPGHAPAAPLSLTCACGMIARNGQKARDSARADREVLMKRILSALAASLLVFGAPAAQAQSKPPLKLGGILDMSSLYADITGSGSETAAKMAVEDFGGEVLGRKIEVVVADHLNKADLAANIARDMFDNQGVEMLFDVAASATALAALEVSKAHNKINFFNGPGSIRLSNEACGPYTVHC